MKINFGLLGLAVAQSGDDRWEDTSYDYDISSDRWSNENQYSLDEANAGITFGVMGRVTKQQNAKHFQKALKLSCWNSNMIRDMNNDNKFSVYFNDQVEYKRFQPGVNTQTGSPAGGTVDQVTGRDDLSWLYAVGDLRTGYNHQYGFEHGSSDPYSTTVEVNRLGANGTAAAASRNNNRLRQNDEAFYQQPFVAGQGDASNTSSKPLIGTGAGINVSDVNHSVRPDDKWTFRKWGYQSDNVERAASAGYNDHTVVYHFGHHDNKDNAANRPNMRWGAISATPDESGTAYDDINKVAHEFDFHGFKDDWRYSLRMGGCLYEAARWVYDESSFHRTGRLTYTDDTLFMDDPFNPMDGTDIFGAHDKGAPYGTTVQNSGEFGNAMFTAGENWINAGSTNVATSDGTTTGSDYIHGDCNDTSCEKYNVATPSSGGVFADVHWVHVFNAHIFPLQDVGYYQYDQQMGLGNIIEENDSITSRDGYGYNIYTDPPTGLHMVMRDVWGKENTAGYIDTANNAPPGNAGSIAITADQFHSQYGTVNIGNVDGQGNYVTGDRPTGGTDNDFWPILTKTRRKIEDFNVVMANPTYEGHGFLNFVATYHDHTENYDDSSNAWIRQVGKRFLSTIGGLTTASNAQRNVCRALKDGIDSYRTNGLRPQLIAGSTNNSGGYGGVGHDDQFLAPLGPGPAGNYGNGQRCGAAMYENFGDWFLRPAQTYAAYNKFEVISTEGITTPATGWSDTACGATSDNLCLGGMESYNYWAFILSEDYDPIVHTTGEWMSAHELWRNGSLHYDRRGSSGSVGTGGSTTYESNSSGRGFAISSFPHNELGKDFRFNIRTLHNMGNGVAKQYYQIQNLTSSTGNEYGQTVNFTTLRTSNLRTSETVWSYYFYAVDTIKIAFPEFVARVNHCDRHSHRNSSHCTANADPGTDNGNPDTGGASNGKNILSAYPGYNDGHPYRRLGFQDIIIDGVTMKKTDNQYDSRVTSTSRGTHGNWHKQYHNARGLRGDDHTRASLHYLDTEFKNEDKSLDEGNSGTPMCSGDVATTNMDRPMYFFGTNDASLAGGAGKFQGYTDSYQPQKPCASWCALDEYAANVANGSGLDNSKQAFTASAAGVDDVVDGVSSLVGAGSTLSKYGGICGRILRIDGLLQTYDELHNRQYGTIQEIWVQLQYAYQESLDNSARTTSGETCDKRPGVTPTRDCDTGAGIRKVQSPFPNVFFSAPEVVDIRGFCPSSNMKCRGYMSDQHQPYGGARDHEARVHWNASATRFTDQANAFGANQLRASSKQSGNDWTMDRDFRGDSKWPWNYHSYNAGDADNKLTGLAYGQDATGTKYFNRDYNHNIYTETGKK